MRERRWVLDRSRDNGVLGYIAALFFALPFLVLYIDGSLKAFIPSVQSQWGLRVASAISTLGYGLVNASVAAALLVIGLKAGKPREAVAGRLGLLAVIVGGLSGQVLKNLFCRARPFSEGSGQFFFQFPCLGKGAGLISFPSGHSVTSFGLAYVLSRTYPRWSLIFYGLATLVALSRVYLAKHFPSDVVAGAAVGLLAGWLVCRPTASSRLHGRT